MIGYRSICQFKTIGLNLLISQIFHFPCSGSGPVYRFIVHQHDDTVFGHTRIDFHNVNSSVQRDTTFNTGNRVFRNIGIGRISSVSHDPNFSRVKVL